MNMNLFSQLSTILEFDLNICRKAESTEKAFDRFVLVDKTLPLKI